MSELLACVETGPGDAQFSVIWLHGLGADGHDFEPIVDELEFANKPQTRFVFPHAPKRAVTVNGGYVMRAWYDIAAQRIEAQQDEKGIRESAAQIEALISREHERGVPSARIVLAGFSQGGAIALFTGLRYTHPLAGVMALSTYLPLIESFKREHSQQNLATPIFMAHGSHDPVVHYLLGEQSRDVLNTLGYHVDFHSYPMEHSVHPKEIADISHWLNQVLS